MEIVVDNQIGVGFGGRRYGAHVDDRFDVGGIVLKKFEHVIRRHNIGQIAICDVAPFIAFAQPVANDDLAQATLFQRPNDIRAYESGPAGNYVHRTIPL